jgi:arsenate reductase (thioredoxin)
MLITTSVLFVCDDNAATSLMAESILRSVGAARFKACSAGIAPAPQPHRLLLDFLRDRHMPASGLRTKSWHEFALPEAPRFDFVITLSERAEDELPARWGAHLSAGPVLAHWSLDEEAEALQHAAQAGDAMRDAFWILQRRIKILASLPLGSAPRRSIQHRVEALATWQ